MHRHIGRVDVGLEQHGVGVGLVVVALADGVAAGGPAEQVGVGASAAVEPVIARATVEDVVGLVVAHDRVVAGGGPDHHRLHFVHRQVAAVGEDDLLQRVGAVAVLVEVALQPCGVAAAGDGQQQVVAGAVAAHRHVGRLHVGIEQQDVDLVLGIARVDGVVARAAAEAEGVGAFVAVEAVVAGAAVEEVVAVPGVDQVVAGAAEQHVVAVTAVDGVVARAGCDHVVGRAAGVRVAGMAGHLDVELGVRGFQRRRGGQRAQLALQQRFARPAEVAEMARSKAVELQQVGEALLGRRGDRVAEQRLGRREVVAVALGADELLGAHHVARQPGLQGQCGIHRLAHRFIALVQELELVGRIVHHQRVSAQQVAGAALRVGLGGEGGHAAQGLRTGRGLVRHAEEVAAVEGLHDVQLLVPLGHQRAVGGAEFRAVRVAVVLRADDAVAAAGHDVVRAAHGADAVVAHDVVRAVAVVQ